MKLVQDKRSKKIQTYFMMNQMWKSKRKFCHLLTARLQIFQYWHSMKISFAIMGSGKNALLIKEFLILLMCLYGCIFIHTIQRSIAEKSFSPFPKTNIGILSVCILRQQAWTSTECIREIVCNNFDTLDMCLPEDSLVFCLRSYIPWMSIINGNEQWWNKKGHQWRRELVLGSFSFWKNFLVLENSTHE